ncbi:S-adenosyl-L-methionine-dependent methyltransferase [Eremomyces bilateralis CBS 781.70]|uniref:tRNA (uracil(54)-C(5))-methyltransferase n=1 Tax=Eremomyces bilateralis CBS 781.70 TaxID=1392243 RepID=A0A6G1G894_9PEZI|nr:S-adenosyl-L-methionine-dependent methyltransferase [Eremomyces bilateralis CBS 781.70]KAF1814212.1 S-adenosyl-L-methionine-dependent methyltransferase [Eremomyces bilateralis CBS 781.70]
MPPAQENRGTKRKPKYAGGKKQAKKQKKGGDWIEASSEDILLEDVRALLEKQSLGVKEPGELVETQTELELDVGLLSSTGDGLAFNPKDNRVYVVPFTVPGDRVLAKVFRHMDEHPYSMTDFVKVLEPSSLRDDSRIGCQYFSKCSGCQFQMMAYDDQLAHKKTIVEKAFRNFSTIDPTLLPPVGDTIGSPLQYGYRTKLTPHFDGPPGFRSNRKKGIKAAFTEVPPIGYMLKNTRKTLDIEDCPIGTEAVLKGLKRERQLVVDHLDKYSRGATILLRESTKRIPKPEDTPATDESATSPPDVVREEFPTHYHDKTYIADQRATSTEYVDDFIFENPAGSFFQNNNSILSPFTHYIRSHILPSNPAPDVPPLKYLIDAYCGSGLFTITLSSLFEKSLGIDISDPSIDFARRNARLNHLSESRAQFHVGNSERIFEVVEFPPEETAVVIDPSRKGCDLAFLRQLLLFGPARVVYVSCNVHTQARDVGALVNGVKGVDGGFGEGEGAYEVESVRGFDFFPQTSHVEGVAVLRKKQIV